MTPPYTYKGIRVRTFGDKWVNYYLMQKSKNPDEINTTKKHFKKLGYSVRTTKEDLFVLLWVREKEYHVIPSVLE